MQIFLNLLRVIFLLSTIVIVTDCCSSRILLLREHTLNIVQQTQNFHSHHLHEHSKLEDTPKTLAKEILEQLQLYLAEISTMPNDLDAETTTPAIDTPIDDTGQQSESVTTETSDIPKVNTTAASVKQPNAAADDGTARVLEEYPLATAPCEAEMAESYCLNGGSCFIYVVGNNSTPSCVCVRNYGGERCDLKNGDYVGPAASELKKRSNVRAARIVFSFPMLLTLSIFYLIIGALYVFRCPNKQQKYRAAGMLAS